MFEEWLESDDFPGTRVLVRPLTGPQVADIQSRTELDGETVYKVLRRSIVSWEHLPLLRGKFAEKYDPRLVDAMEPGCAFWLLGVLYRELSCVTEEERRNLFSRSTSSSSASTATPAAASTA